MTTSTDDGDGQVDFREFIADLPQEVILAIEDALDTHDAGKKAQLAAARKVERVARLAPDETAAATKLQVCCMRKDRSGVTRLHHSEGTAIALASPPAGNGRVL